LSKKEILAFEEALKMKLERYVGEKNEKRIRNNGKDNK